MALTLSNSGTGGVFTLRGGSFGGRFTTSVTPPGLLLDTYPGAATAYSLRKLRAAYSGAAIRVRRSSDNTETNIGFSGTGGLDTTALSTFVGANDGFVTTWYDQSGNGFNAISQNTATQPKIINSGVIFLFNNKPSLYFLGSYLGVFDYLFAYPQPNTYFIVNQNTEISPTGVRALTDGYYYSTANRNSVGLNSNTYYLYAGVFPNSSVTTINDKNLLSAVFNTTNSFLYKNNIAIISNQNAGNAQQSGLGIGGSSITVNNFQGYIPEYIYYHLNQNTNLSGINANINAYYSIY